VVRVVVALALLLLAPNAYSGSTDTISYQGLLKGPDGSPLDGTVEIVTRIWNAASGGSIQWSELHSNVQVTDGLFEIALGQHNTPTGPKRRVRSYSANGAFTWAR
jgi:hypothetical protein